MSTRCSCCRQGYLRARPDATRRVVESLTRGDDGSPLHAELTAPIALRSLRPARVAKAAAGEVGAPLPQVRSKMGSRKAAPFPPALHPLYQSMWTLVVSSCGDEGGGGDEGGILDDGATVVGGQARQQREGEGGSVEEGVPCPLPRPSSPCATGRR